MRRVLLALGGTLILLGGLWTLQGVGIVGGSFMSGASLWARIGIFVLIAGVLLCVLGLRTGTARPRL